MAERRGQMRVHKTSSCHLWLGSTGGTGYGKLMVCKMWWQPHRFAWILANGEPIPVGMDVMHSCDTPACCNPAHLSVGTRSQNMKDAVAKGRWHSYGAGLNRTHCRNGHAYDEENTRVTAKGVRICRVCAAESSRRYREKV
jgi:hypothetical protein